MKRISWRVFLILSVAALPARAETLNEVLSHTYENSLAINAERANLKAIGEGVEKARAGYHPNVYVQGSIGRAHNKMTFDNAAIGSFTQTYDQTPRTASVNLVQPVFSGGTTYNAVGAAQKQVQSGRSGLKNTEQAVLLDAAAVYMDVIRDKAVLDLQVNNEKVLKKHLESYKKRFQAGDLTRTDVAQSEARVSGATAARIAAAGRLEIAKATFYSVVGLEPVRLKDVTEISLNIPKTLDACVAEALQGNPKVRAAEYMRDAMASVARAKKGIISPRVDVQASAGMQDRNTQIKELNYWQVTANLNVPLYQAGTEYAEVREAKSLENKHRILAEKTKQDVRAETIAAWEEYQAVRAQIKSLKAQIKASKTALDGVIREADVGARTVLDVLDAEQEYLNSQVAFVKAHRDEIVSAYALMSALGRLMPDQIGLDAANYNPEDYDGFLWSTE
ncbi:MAG: TolC family outer membrane protein [Alphaproteobacteria bacterium]|nr:TolC family outer membrane protein [Alphaproteobacteria bacterium]